MLKLFRFGLAFTAALGVMSLTIARPAAAVEDNAASSSRNFNQTVAGLAILGAGAAIVVYGAKQGNYLPQSLGSAKLQQAKHANPQLQKKLLRLLHNDRDTANRLIAQIKLTHPDRSANWVMEKVIYDLERDRNRQ